MKTVKLRTLAAAFLLATAGAALADSETVSYTIATTEAGGANNGSFDLNGFDTSLGVLTGVTVAYDLSTTSEATVFTADGGTYSNATSSYSLTLTGTGVDVVINTSAGPAAGTAPMGASVAATNTETTNSSIVIPVSDFSAYETPQVSFSLASSPFTSGGSPRSGPGFIALGGDGSYGGPVSVTYNFTAVPEPSSWSMMSVALAGLAFAAYRTRRLQV